MMTKENFCKMIIKRFYRYENIPVENITEDNVTKSSSLGVAMEYLGLIKSKHLKEYISQREGIYDTFIDEDNIYHVISVRDMLDILPE